MKKFTLILASFFYMLSVLGIGIQKDYCCGKLRSTTFFNHQSDKKHCKGKAMTGCCRTENAFYKLNDSHETATAIIVHSIHPEPAVLAYQEFQEIFASSTTAYLFDHTNDPPHRKHLPVYLLNCNFRI